MPPLTGQPVAVVPLIGAAPSAQQSAGGGTAAAVSAGCDPTDPALLQETDEIEFTPRLDELLATLLNDPVLVYRHVRDQVDYAPYYGSRKSAEHVLQTRRGNDFDQASLLIAAFRRLGIPACYVRGTAEFTFPQLTSWLGVDGNSEAATVIASAYIPSTFAGNAQIEHVWVEA